MNVTNKGNSPMSNSYYAKKILFNITKTDLYRMDLVRSKMNLEKSEFIRRAIRAYVAEQMMAEFKNSSEVDIRVSPDFGGGCVP